jgi:23S rRNA pseudouridine2605 synthase
MTLGRAFSKAGVFSRTEALLKIRSGGVKVNGRVIRNPEHWVSLSKDTIHYDGQVLRKQKKVYLMFYKPTGVVTTHGDPDDRQTVYDFLGNAGSGSFPSDASTWIHPACFS